VIALQTHCIPLGPQYGNPAVMNCGTVNKAERFLKAIRGLGGQSVKIAFRTGIDIRTMERSTLNCTANELRRFP
jgi:hypothetical protein